MKSIYLDHHATTPVDPRVMEKMLPFFTRDFGNAASKSHPYGQFAAEAVEQARKQVADTICAEPADILFTGGATESINLALKGVAGFYREKGTHIITAVTEHRAVLDSCQELENKGFQVTRLPVGPDGMLDLDELEAAITPETILISLMHANHEIGTIHPIAEIGRIAKEKRVFFHCDATQAFAKEKIDVEACGIDLLSASAHKIYGPKGVGFLYLRRKNPRVRLEAQINGGGHERGYRSGTLNVPAIVGMGATCALYQTEAPAERHHMRHLHTLLKSKLTVGLTQIRFNGHPEKRMPGNLSVSFAGVSGHQLLREIQEIIAVSSGASCTSAIPAPSYILKAIQLPAEYAQATIRFGLGRFNTEAEMGVAATCLIDAVNRLRNQNDEKGRKHRTALACNMKNESPDCATE